MRAFRGLLFFGNGRFSRREAAVLRKRINYAMAVLSGLQQGGSGVVGSPEYLKEEEEIKDVVRDVAAALLGRNVSFGYTLPYPPK